MDRPDEQRRTDYLAPYERAVARHGDGFGSLLWANVRTQELRFAAFADAVKLEGLTLLDVGCGRGDLFPFLVSRGNAPARYVGLEAVPTLAEAARRVTGQTVVESDFVASSESMCVDADVIYFSGSLNTLDDHAFCDVLEHAFDAARSVLAFNFLSSAFLAAASYLYERDTKDVLDLMRELSATEPTLICGYLNGDTTVVVRR